MEALTYSQKAYRKMRNDPARWAKHLEKCRMRSTTDAARARRRARDKGTCGPRQMKRYYANPQVKLRVLASVYISRCVTIYGAKKTKNTMRYVGCSKAQLVAHIEKQFEKGMTWENYGQWEIDHIHPLSKWDLTDPMQMGLANHFTNLRPLWKGQNAAKSNHITEDWQMPLGT